MRLGTLVLVETLNKVFWDSASNPPKTGNIMGRKRRIICCDKYIARKAYFGTYNLGLWLRNLGTGRNRSIGESCLGKATMQRDQQKQPIAPTKIQKEQQ